MSRLIDLTGQTIGRWTVLSQAASAPDRRTMWLCQCGCGNQKPVCGKSLRYGTSKSCGCLRNELGDQFGRRGLIDLTGRVFSRWTVLHRYKDVLPVRWICRCECGTEKSVYGKELRTGGSKSCGCLRDELASAKTGPKHSSWKGGRRVASTGYIEVYEPEHPNAFGHGRKYVFEHRLVMEKYLGRYLTSGEAVHHINGIKTDNRLENLELWASSQPTGQRVSDKVAWAKEILALYEPEALAESEKESAA